MTVLDIFLFPNLENTMQFLIKLTIYLFKSNNLTAPSFETIIQCPGHYVVINIWLIDPYSGSWSV
jgi:hypothetical protein